MHDPIERKLSPAVSGGTIAAVLDYLVSFGSGAGVVYDSGGRAFIRLKSAQDQTLLERQFPGLLAPPDAAPSEGDVR